MQIVVNEPEMLVLQNRSRWIGAVLAIGALLWVVTVMGSAVSGAVNISTQNPLPTYYALRMLLLTMVFALGGFSAFVGGQTAIKMMRGITCIFDRSTEQVTITRPMGFKLHIQQHSIYGVSHATMERNDELQVTALYLVLRSGQRISLGTCNRFETEQAERVVHHIRTFLKER